MAQGLSSRQFEVLSFLVFYYRSNSTMPSHKEVCAELGLSSQSASASSQLQKALVEKGFLKELPRGTRSRYVLMWDKIVKLGLGVPVWRESGTSILRGRFSDRELAAMKFVVGYVRHECRLPTTRELADELSLGSTASASALLGRLERKGLLSRRPGEKKVGLYKINWFAAVGCGFPYPLWGEQGGE